MLAGAAAMSFRKGSRRHRATGNLFVISMLGLGASGAWLGFTKHQTLNGCMGVLTFYLVTTAWVTARRRDGTGLINIGALMVPLVVGASLVLIGVETASSATGSKEEYPAAAYFIFGSLALLLAAGDVRMLTRGGFSGAQRIARHLGRMCLGLFIAVGSFFLGQQQVFPAALRSWPLLLAAPVILTVVLMIFWLVRVRFTKYARSLDLLEGRRFTA